MLMGLMEIGKGWITLFKKAMQWSGFEKMIQKGAGAHITHIGNLLKTGLFLRIILFQQNPEKIHVWFKEVPTGTKCASTCALNHVFLFLIQINT